MWIAFFLVAAHDSDFEARATRAIDASIVRTRLLLTSTEFSETERRARLRAEAEAMTDYAELTRRAADNQWSTMTVNQRRRFQRALHTLLLEAHLSSLDNFDPSYRLRSVGAELNDHGETWVDLELSGLRFVPLRFGFLLNSDLRVVDARLGSFRLVDHLQETVDRVVANEGIERPLEQLERKADSARRQGQRSSSR
ncbi:MAG: ABC transporter substrate-binding protein [Myxococcota bacterium]